MPYNFDVEKAIKSFHKEFGKENKELNAQQVFYALSLFTTHHLVKDIRDTLMSNKITLEEYALFTRGMGLLPEEPDNEDNFNKKVYQFATKNLVVKQFLHNFFKLDEQELINNYLPSFRMDELFFFKKRVGKDPDFPIEYINNAIKKVELTQRQALISIVENYSKHHENLASSEFQSYLAAIPSKDLYNMKRFFNGKSAYAELLTIVSDLIAKRELQLAKQFFDENPTATKFGRKNSESKFISDPASVAFLKKHGIREMESSYLNLEGKNLKKEIHKQKPGKAFGEGGFSRVKESMSETDSVFKIEAYNPNNAESRKAELDMLREVGILRSQGVRELSQPRKFKYATDATKLSYTELKKIEGQELRKALGNQSYTPEQKQIIALNAMMAIQELHDKNILHRDIKPENFIVDKNLNVTAIDFNLAKKMDPETKMHEDKYIVGTPGYRPPEVEKSAHPVVYNPGTDIYSLGMMFTSKYDLNLSDPLLQQMADKTPSKRPELLKAILEMGQKLKDDPDLTGEHKEKLYQLAKKGFERGEISEENLNKVKAILDVKIKGAEESVPSHDTTPSRRAETVLPSHPSHTSDADKKSPDTLHSRESFSRSNVESNLGSRLDSNSGSKEGSQKREMIKKHMINPSVTIKPIKPQNTK